MVSLVHKEISKQAWLIFILAAFFCAYEFSLRVMISALATKMQIDFNTTQQGISYLSCGFLIGYAPIQLFGGYILQKFGIRKSFNLALAVCSLSLVIFSVIDNLYLLFILRVIMGLGSGFAIIGTFLLIANWFPTRIWATLYGSIQLIVCIGAIFGQSFFSQLTQIMNWQHCSIIFSMLGVCIWCGFLFFLRDKPPHTSCVLEPSSDAFSTQLNTIIHNRLSWIIASYALLTWGPLTVSATLWGPVFIAQKMHVSLTIASHIISFVWLGVGIGSPIIGWYSRLTPNHAKLLLWCAAFGLISSICFIYVPFHSMSIACLFSFLIGFSTAGQPITFVHIQKFNPPQYSGAAIGFNNTMIITGGAILQPLSGILIMHYQGNYISGLSLMPTCYALSIFVIWLYTQNTSNCEVYAS